MKIRTREYLWFSDLRDSFKTPTWKTLGLSLILVMGYYAVLFLVSEYVADFDFEIPGFVVYSLGYVIAILFYFRLNNSYYRYTDGYKATTYLRGNAESFIIKCRTYLKSEEDVKILSALIKNHYRAFRDIVHGFQNAKNMIDASPDFQRDIKGAYHLPTRLNSLIEIRLNLLYKEGKLTRAQFLDLNRTVTKNSEHVSSAEALKGTPPPKIYITHIRGFILAYALMIPFGFIHHFEAWMLLFLAVFFYFYAGLEIVSDEMEDPFGYDRNDIPLEELTDWMERRIDDIKDIKLSTFSR